MLDGQMFRHCVSTETEAHKNLVFLVKKQAELTWVGDLLPRIWTAWTKRGLTQYSMVHHALNAEIDAYLDFVYFATTTGYNKRQMTRCMEQWAGNASPWTMSMHCYKNR